MDSAQLQHLFFRCVFGNIFWIKIVCTCVRSICIKFFYFQFQQITIRSQERQNLCKKLANKKSATLKLVRNAIWMPTQWPIIGLRKHVLSRISFCGQNWRDSHIGRPKQCPSIQHWLMFDFLVNTIAQTSRLKIAFYIHAKIQIHQPTNTNATPLLIVWR